MYQKLLTPGRIIFAVAMIGLGGLCIVYQDFIVGRPPAWSFNPGILGYASGTLLILLSIAILSGKKGSFAALILALMIISMSLSRHARQFLVDWPNGYKTLGLIGGALVVAAAFLAKEDLVVAGIRIKKKGTGNLLLIGTMLVASFFIAAGYAHFKWADFVPTLIPAFIPFPVFWTYFCGVCLIAGGIGILIDATRKLAALLSGMMVLGWFLLLHIPRFLADPSNMSDRLGLFESFAFVGIFFVMAGMFSRK